MKPVWVIQVRLGNGKWVAVGADERRTTAERNSRAYFSYSLPPRILRYIPATLQKKRRKP